jgi:hypothetical protein
MKKIIQTESFVVYDDVLEENQFQQVYNYIQNEHYSIPHLESWSKVWRLTDGYTFGGKNYDTSKGPFNNYVDIFTKMYTDLALGHPELVGDYKNLSIRSYLYPRETKLSWHNDKGYKAAVIFYTHPYWASTWGGDLMIAYTPELNKDYVPNPCLDHTFEDKFIGHYGMGQYISCKPNRMVLTKGGVWHSINRVDKDAGDHVRSSVVGFYLE